MSVKIVGINGSPKKNGNTAKLLNVALEKAKEIGADIELIHASEFLNELAVPFCVDCSAPCKGICLKGEKVEAIVESLKRADGVILASPVYFGTVSAQMKAFWDKIRSLRGEKALLNTVGGAMSTGATRFGGQETTLRAMQDMMLVQGMTVVGGGYYENDCGHLGVASQKPTEEDTFATTRAEIIAKRIFQVALATKEIRNLA